MGSCDYEAVSALVDGELNEQECDGVIRHLNECRECCRLFERFHANRTLVRGEGGLDVPQDLCDRVSAAIANESSRGRENVTAMAAAGSGPKRVARSPWTWVATAAGVAGIALAAGLLLQQTPTPNGSATSPSLAQSAQPEPEARAQQPDSDNVAAIKRYLPEHSSFVPSGSGAEFQRARLEVDKR